MLLGRYENSIDAKNRLIIPAKFRDDLGYKAILTKGLDDCLILFPMSTWEKQEQVLAGLPMSDPKTRAFKRFLYANAFECEVDKQGRILVPNNLKLAAQLEKELITIGSLDRIEIWAREKYDNDENGGKLSAEDFADFSDKYQV
ncbi:MAG: division/cell wall cluster transcriptional repressor MraZ [Bacillota bacterium]|nr:division/cell wall cluster transcriptional repressor MraZ [Bacillota bacterium]